MLSHAGMLRASSSAAGDEVRLAGVRDASVDVGVPLWRQISAATDACVLFDADEIDTARSDLVDEMGESAAIRVFAVAGNFQMMNRLLDAIGARVPDRLQPIADEIGVAIPSHLAEL